MTTKRRKRGQERVAAPIAEPAVDIDTTRIVQHPDGYYWCSEDGRRETGPFPTFEEALTDMMRAEESETEPAETLQEAESEIGIADWIDPETREPVEEERPRLDDH